MLDSFFVALFRVVHGDEEFAPERKEYRHWILFLIAPFALLGLVTLVIGLGWLRYVVRRETRPRWRTWNNWQKRLNKFALVGFLSLLTALCLFGMSQSVQFHHQIVSSSAKLMETERRMTGDLLDILQILEDLNATDQLSTISRINLSLKNSSSHVNHSFHKFYFYEFIR
jgi:H+/Cl- antiporter ClcA